ncbi:PREDICTED: uncharacterized protein C22orf46 homolog [Elephantulus edwardii]|uniref:uncharacterized protein C22orf46 homolog n=1 Tax=Elephantulus edwardii TaxID=28737 RepID=UPI0003F099FC|nr:PREDICTED: uncharacterized protein C22orf46 homolog [Elephantulus edwardii]
MLLPLLGACALVGPFQGSEWEPVRGLLSQHDSCRDPRCYGKLVLLCLFLIWQVQHFWLQFHQRCTKQKKVIKVPWQEWVEPSTRRSPVLRAASDIISRPRKVSRPKHGHGQQRTWKHRWEPQKGLQESWAQRLLSWQHRCQGPPWSAHTHLEPILGPTTFSNTCLLPWNGAWDSSQVPWHLRDGHTTLTGQPLSLGLEMHQRREQLSVPSPEELERPEPPISMSSDAASLVQRGPACSL